MKKIVFIVIVLLSVASLFYFTNYLVNPCDEILIDKVLSDHTNEAIIEEVADEVNEMMSERAIFVF